MNDNFPMQVRMFSPDLFPYFSIHEELPLDVVCPEMSKDNMDFLYTLFKKYKPGNILECGVSAGGTAALFLYLMDKLDLRGKLVSVDLLTNWYKDKTLETGWGAKRLFPDKKNWTLLTGKFLPEIIEDLNMGFDFCLLDTVHQLPGELLDFLVVLPFMNEGGIIAFHDTMLHLIANNNAYSNRLVMDVCSGNKIYSIQDNPTYANISAVEITPDSYKYIGNLFSAMNMKWAYPLDDNQFGIYYDFFNRYYGSEAADWFKRATEWNNINFPAHESQK